MSSITTKSFRLPFTKMQGAGNDVVVLNAMQGLPALTAEQFKILGDRRYGVGCDQILIVAPPANPDNDFSYRIVNQDGSEVEHCGNGARCFMRFVREQGLTQKTSVRVEIARGVIVLNEYPDGQIEVNMGAPDFDAASLPFDTLGLSEHTLANGFKLFDIDIDIDIDIDVSVDTQQPATCIGAVSMGNPHAVHVVANVDTAPVGEIGPAIELHPAFPNRVNVGFMQVVSPHHIKLRVWERGAGETLACGTGACAAVAVGICMGLLQSPVAVQARGGALAITWGGAGTDLLMRGPAVTVYHGTIELS